MGIGEKHTMKANDFISRHHVALSAAEMDHINKTYTLVDCKKLKDIDDPKYDWQMVYCEGNDEKYGRTMVSHSQKVYRWLTMGEFYGSGIVD